MGGRDRSEDAEVLIGTYQRKNLERGKQMIKVSVLYANKAGSRFDADYYLNVHMPMAAKLLGPALKAVTAEIGVAGGAPGEPPAFAAIAGFTCESVETFLQAFMPVIDQLQGDIPKYTDIEPVIQFSDLTEFAIARE
jgi:uncharacterized protein (TIGR02118 family)